MASRAHKVCSYLLHVLLILYQVQTSLEETFTNETSTSINNTEQVSFHGTAEVTPFTIDTTAETGGAAHPEPSVYNVSADPDLSFSTGGENPVTTNTTADSGGENPVTTNTTADTREENPVTTNTTADTGGENPVTTNTTADTGEENPVTTNTTADTGGENPFTTNSTADIGGENPVTTNTTTDTVGENPVTTNTNAESGGENPVTTNTNAESGGENPVTTNSTADTGGASYPDLSLYNVSTDPGLILLTKEVIPITTNLTEETVEGPHPDPLMSNASADQDISFPIEEKNPMTTNPTTETGGVPHPEPSVYNASADPDLFLPTRDENPGIGNATAETGGASYPESDNSTELGSLYPTGGGITVTTSTMEVTRGPSYPDLISCLLDTDCPPLSSCTSGPGPHTCHCHLGLYFHPHLGCVTARTFPARLAISALRSTDGTIRGDGQPETPMYREVTELFGGVFGNVRGYLSTSLAGLRPSEGHVTVLHSFSTLHEITEEDLREELSVSALRCEEGNGSSCISLLAGDVYQSLSLCDFALCDSSSSDCQSHAGLVTCKCQNGYYKFDPSDRSCRACESGFRWTEDRCQRCPLGYGGFNCQEALLLVVIVESCVVGVLLVLLVTVLFYYFRRKKKPKPTFMDSLVLGAATDQPVLRLPRAQFSWRREWEWTDQPGKILEDLHREGTGLNQNSEPSDIQMRTFGSVSRTSVPSFNRGSHNLAFISDD